LLKANKANSAIAIKITMSTIDPRLLVAIWIEIKKFVEEGVALKEDDLLWFVMKRSRGTVNPTMVKEFLNEQGLPYGSKKIPP